jgi:hypothetical protein
VGRPGARRWWGQLLHDPERQADDHVGIGINNPDLTLEDVRDHFDEIRDETGYSVPSGVADEIASLVGRLR